MPKQFLQLNVQHWDTYVWLSKLADGIKVYNYYKKFMFWKIQYLLK